MHFELPPHLVETLAALDAFIEREIRPLEEQDDNGRFFDHRREDARTDWDRGGLPNEEWEALLAEAKRLADAAGHYRYAAPRELGGRDGTNLDMAIIREHLACKGLGLHNDLQNEHSIVGNSVGLLLLLHYGTPAQKREWQDRLASGTGGFTMAITESAHGSDATHMETTATRDGDDWILNGEKSWNTGIHKASHAMVLARTSGEAGNGQGITAFLTPTDAAGFELEEMLWTFNMPTDHGRFTLTNVRVPDSTIFGGEGRGLQVVQHFFNENRIRQAASSLGAAQFCVDEAVKFAQERRPFGKPLSTNQGIQFPLVELQTQCEMLRALIHKTAWQMDEYGAFSVSDKVSMCNYWSNRLCCEAADRAMQVHGGLGYSRHKPFEHIYRHHRRYRITEGAEEIQMRRVAGYLFGFMNQQAPKGVADDDQQLLPDPPLRRRTSIMSEPNVALESFRATARAWLDENFPSSLAGRGAELVSGEQINSRESDLETWCERLGAKGWATPTWPAEYGGGGLTQLEAQVLGQEMKTAGAFNPLILRAGMGITMVGPTILEYGTEDQKKRHIPPICRGEYFWALGYSEPNAGSDLASLQCRAEDKGDHWIVNGQKTWTSGADRAQWIGCLVRTDLDVPKRDGISFVMLPMDQPGIETRPIRLIAGESPFCETFFDDAKTDKAELLGPLNGGWTVGKRLLQHERQSQTGARGAGGTASKKTIAELAKEYIGTDADGRVADPDLRARLAGHLMRDRAQRLTLERITAEARGQAKVTATASILKNAASAISQESAELALEIMGHNGLGWEGDEFETHELEAVRHWLSGKAISIYGGSFEIQNNIIAKSILGLPETTQRG